MAGAAIAKILNQGYYDETDDPEAVQMVLKAQPTYPTRMKAEETNARWIAYQETLLRGSINPTDAAVIKIINQGFYDETDDPRAVKFVLEARPTMPTRMKAEEAKVQWIALQKILLRGIDPTDDPRVVREVLDAQASGYARQAHDEQSAARQYALAFGKFVAGSCRFLFEDVLQSFCQGIWLCKMWTGVTMSSKAFTLCSMASGFFLSLGVPVMEYLEIRRMRNQADPKAYKMMTMDAADGEVQNSVEPKIDLSVASPKPTKYPMKVSVATFLSGQTAHSKTAHRGLLLSASVFWGYMVAYPKIFEGQITCKSSPPVLGLQIFFALWVFDLVLQVWVLCHTQHGYDIMIHKPVKFASGALFSLLGRFDTYGDVSFSYKLIKCEEITWFSIWGHVFSLPFPLVYFAVFALVLGVFCAQAVPGMLLLCRRQKLPLAMKFNEFNLILSVMTAETAELEREEE